MVEERRSHLVVAEFEDDDESPRSLRRRAWGRKKLGGQAQK
jgi:hypothetical protein